MFENLTNNPVRVCVVFCTDNIINRPFPSCLLPRFQNDVPVQNLSCENEFDLLLNKLVRKTDFHVKGFALGLVLKQRQTELGNGPIKKLLW